MVGAVMEAAKVNQHVETHTQPTGSSSSTALSQSFRKSDLFHWIKKKINFFILLLKKYTEFFMLLYEICIW